MSQHPVFLTSHSSDTSLWLPVTNVAHTTAERASLVLVSNEPTIGDIRRYTFDLTGPDHLNVYLSPADENHLVEWSFLGGEFEMMKWNGRETYFVFLGSGDAKSDRHTVRFYIDIEVSVWQFWNG